MVPSQHSIFLIQFDQLKNMCVLEFQGFFSLQQTSALTGACVSSASIPLSLAVENEL